MLGQDPRNAVAMLTGSMFDYPSGVDRALLAFQSIHERQLINLLQRVAGWLTHEHHERMNAYSRDLREKIVEAVYGRGMGKSEAARVFGVSLSSVKRYARAANEGRSLAPKKSPGSKPKLDERARRLLAADLEERPFATLSERRDYLKVVAGVSVSDSTVCRELGRMEHTRKKGA